MLSGCMILTREGLVKMFKKIKLISRIMNDKKSEDFFNPVYSSDGKLLGYEESDSHYKNRIIDRINKDEGNFKEEIESFLSKYFWIKEYFIYIIPYKIYIFIICDDFEQALYIDRDYLQKRIVSVGIEYEIILLQNLDAFVERYERIKRDMV